MNRLATFALLAALAAPVFAQSPTPTPIGSTPVVFATVDAVSVENYSTSAERIYLTGVVEGDAAATTRYVTVATPVSAFCQSAALLAMERPGRYRLQVVSNACKLIRANP